MDIPTTIFIISTVTGSAIIAVLTWVIYTLIAEQRAERRYKADPDAFFEKERQDTDKYDIPALLAKMENVEEVMGDDLLL